MLISLKNMKKKELHIFTDKQINRKVLFILLFFIPGIFTALSRHKVAIVAIVASAFESQHYTQKRK